MISIVPTVAETLLIWRRREGLSQNAAKRLNSKWGSWERGSSNPPDSILIMLEHVQPTPGEEAMLLRRRHRIRIRDITKALGISHVSIIKLERGEIPAGTYPSRLLALIDGRREKKEEEK